MRSKTDGASAPLLTPHSSLLTAFQKAFPMHTLKTRIVLIVLAIFLSGLLALMAYTRHTVISDMKDLLGKQQFSMVSTVAASVSHALWERIVTLQEVARPLSASTSPMPVKTPPT